MTTSNTAYLAALIGSRICHDLISPVGAIGNGLELLSMTGETNGGAEYDLISESFDSADTRLRFFRIAFGAADPEQSMAAWEIRKALAGLAPSGKLSVSWNADHEVMRPELRLLFLALLCIQSTLPAGGQITAAHIDQTWELNATGPKILVKDTLWMALRRLTPSTDVMPKEVQFPLLALHTRNAGRKITMNYTDNTLTLRL